jgi:hypothetical protein
MKLEKTLFKISIKETLILSIFFFFLLNGFVFLISLITGKPRFLLYDTAWILQIIFPFVYSTIQTSINRNGVLKITEYDDITNLVQHIESLFLKQGYIVEKSNNNNVSFAKKTKWGRFFNNFFRENINIQIRKGELLIFSKRNLLLYIIMKLKQMTRRISVL